MGPYNRLFCHNKKNLDYPVRIGRTQVVKIIEIRRLIIAPEKRSFLITMFASVYPNVKNLGRKIEVLFTREVKKKKKNCTTDESLRLLTYFVSRVIVTGLLQDFPVMTDMLTVVLSYPKRKTIKKTS